MRMEPVTVALPRDLKRWLEKAAKQTDQTLGSYVRRILKLHRTTEEEESHERAESVDPAVGPETGGA